MLPRGGAARLLPGGNEVVPNFPAPPNNMDVALPPFQRCAGSSRINSPPPPPTHTQRHASAVRSRAALQVWRRPGSAEFTARTPGSRRLRPEVPGPGRGAGGCRGLGGAGPGRGAAGQGRWPASGGVRSSSGVTFVPRAKRWCG